MKRKPPARTVKPAREPATETPADSAAPAVAYYRSKIGTLKISGGPDGVSVIEFVEDAPARVRTPDCLKVCVRQLDEYFRRERRTFTVKLDLHGTPFQRRVWHELLTIPFGRTRSYLDVALTIGTRKHLRAVGQANGHNPLPIIVPCHRVIGVNGQLTGYGGGLWRKRWLLDFESNAHQARLF